MNTRLVQSNHLHSASPDVCDSHLLCVITGAMQRNAHCSSHVVLTDEILLPQMAEATNGVRSLSSIIYLSRCGR